MGARYVVLGNQARDKSLVSRERRYGRAGLRLNDPGREGEKQCPPAPAPEKRPATSSSMRFMGSQGGCQRVADGERLPDLAKE